MGLELHEGRWQVASDRRMAVLGYGVLGVVVVRIYGSVIFSKQVICIPNMVGKQLPSPFFGQFFIFKKTSFSDTVFLVARCGPHELQAADLGSWQASLAADVMRFFNQPVLKQTWTKASSMPASSWVASRKAQVSLMGGWDLRPAICWFWRLAVLKRIRFKTKQFWPMKTDSAGLTQFESSMPASSWVASLKAQVSLMDCWDFAPATCCCFWSLTVLKAIQD